MMPPPPWWPPPPVVGGGGPVCAMVMTGGQAGAASGAVAVVEAEIVVTATSAVSCAPWLSVTVSRNTKSPLVGACTIAAAWSAFVMVGGVPVDETTLHANVDTVRLQAAALGCPSSVIVCPAVTLAGTLTNAIGRSAASTAAGASSIPAPQVCVVQMHSVSCTSLPLVGT